MRRVQTSVGVIILLFLVFWIFFLDLKLEAFFILFSFCSVSYILGISYFKFYLIFISYGPVWP